MREDRLKLIKIMSELTNYFFKFDANNISIQIHQNEDNSEITISGVLKGYDLEELEFIKERLNKPRRKELEEYYWNLIGNGDTSQRLNLVSNLVDKSEIEYNEDSLKIKLIRKH